MYPIRMTNKQIQEAVSAIRERLKSQKTTSSTLKFEYKLPTYAKKQNATVVIKELAWKKIKALVDKCDKEIAWHGVVTKTKNEYVIEDIVVFPQMVSAATVTSDETQYSLWLAQQPNEIFNNLRFHGHSHVRMATNPSGVDTQYQEAMLKNLNDFYIFAIFNKQGSHWCMIYDVEDNVVYENSDIVLNVEEDPVEVWATKEMSEKVVVPKPATPAYSYPYGGSARTNYGKSTPANGKKVNKPDKPDNRPYSEQFVERLYDKSGKRITGAIDDEDDDYGTTYGGYRYDY